MTTHPIIQRITTVEQISQAFDNITYRKGEAVIRMLEASVGADAFRDGVRRFLEMEAGGFGNANLITRESRILTTGVILPRLPF